MDLLSLDSRSAEHAKPGQPPHRPTALAERSLPAVRYDVHGKRHVDYRAVVALAAPLFLNSAVQAVLSLTDTWFIGRLSVQAVAAMGATFFLVLVFLLLFGGVGLAVQTLAAQNYGRLFGRVLIDRSAGSDKSIHIGDPNHHLDAAI